MVVPWITGITSYDMMLINDIVRKPCATVVPNAVSRLARSGSTWIN